MKKILLAFLFLTGSIFGQTVLPGKQGGTGVSNPGKTITLGGSIITTGTATPTLAFPSTARTFNFPDTADRVAVFHYTLPRSGTVSGYPLTGPIEFSVGTTALWQNQSTGSGYYFGTGNNSNLASATAKSYLFFQNDYNSLGVHNTSNDGTSIEQGSSFGVYSISLNANVGGLIKTQFLIGNDNTMVITGGSGFKGLQYAASYSGNYTTTSLIDKGYADGRYALTNATFTVNGTGMALGTSSTITAAAGTLTGTTLNSTVVNSSLTSVATVTAGAWNGTSISDGYIATPYIKADGTRQLTGSWATGAYGIGINTGTVAPTGWLHVVETSTNTLRGIIGDQYSNSTNGSKINLRKARGTFASPTIVQTSDVLANFTGLGYDGTNFQEAASFRVMAAATPSTGIVPGKVTIQTANTSGTLTDAVTIDQSQQTTFASHITVEGVTSTGAIGTGKLVFATSPTLTTAELGSSTATTQSFNTNNNTVATTAYVDGNIKVAQLTGDQPMTNTVATTVPNLTVTLDANAKYQVMGVTTTSCSSTGGLKLAVSLPGTSTMSIWTYGNTSTGTAFTANEMITSGTLTTNIFNNVSARLTQVWNGTITTDGGGGVVSFQLAVVTNGQTVTVFNEGTSITLRRIK